MNDAERRIEVIFDDEPTDDVVAELNDSGAYDIQHVRQHGFTGIEIVIAAVLVASSVANLVIKFVRAWKCGVVVDARLAELVIKKNCDLPRGSVLILKSDGTEVRLDTVSDTQLHDLVAAISGNKS